MALPFSGRISASDINIEAQRVSTTRAPLGGTAGEEIGRASCRERV